jgi:ParB family chromosome partitioning protein
MINGRGKGLGRGLDALFSENEQDEKSIQLIDVNDIKPSASQPRQVFNEEKIDELAASISAHGLIQPVILKKSGTGFELVAGERRWRAARKAGLKQVQGIVKELSEEEQMMISLIENVQREDLNPIEEAEAFQRICMEFGLKQEEVSKSVGKSRPYIANSLRLLKLPAEIRQLVLEGKLTSGHARTIVGVEDVSRQLIIANQIVAEGLSVRETEKLTSGEVQAKGITARKTTLKAPDVIGIEEELKELLGTKVSLKHRGNKGKLEIDYFSREELERLIEIFRSLKP